MYTILPCLAKLFDTEADLVYSLRSGKCLTVSNLDTVENMTNNINDVMLVLFKDASFAMISIKITDQVYRLHAVWDIAQYR